jgi:hypothetical protein
MKFKEWIFFETTFKSLKDNKVPLSDEERKMCMDAKAVWHFTSKPTPAVWKSKNKQTGKATYVTNTHRAMATASSCKNAISKFHKFIKGTS